jgi:hypothetical protein
MAEIVKNATMRNPAFLVCLVLSIALIVAGFCVPPTGKIDGSVLTAVGLLLAFATLYEAHLAIANGVDARFRHGKSELTVGDLNTEKITNEGEDYYE